MSILKAEGAMFLLEMFALLAMLANCLTQENCRSLPNKRTHIKTYFPSNPKKAGLRF